MTVIERHPKLDAPYKEGGNRLIDENLKRYLWTGLDYERYEVIKIIPQTMNFTAIVMKSRNTTDTPWCLEYCGTGHYFDTYEELQSFYFEHFKKRLED